MEEKKIITKEDLTKNLEKLMEDVISGNLESIQQRVTKQLQFSVNNYNFMTPEAKEITDNVFKTIRNFVAESIEKMPDSKERRKLRRLSAASLGEHFNADQLIKLLETSPELKEDNSSKEIRRVFPTRLQNIFDFIFDVQQGSFQGASNFAQFGLLCMCANELVAAFHLSQHYYINQAYSHMRTVLEHLDKVRLFRTNQRWADVWCSDDEKKIRTELSPSSVRKKLGQEKFDPLYGLFSILGPHGTFRALQTISAKVTKSSSDKSQFRIWIGGCSFEHNIVNLNFFLLFAVNSTILQIAQSFEELLNMDEVWEVINQCVEEDKEFMKSYIIPWAKKNSFDVTPFERILNTYKVPPKDKIL